MGRVFIGNLNGVRGWVTDIKPLIYKKKFIKKKKLMRTKGRLKKNSCINITFFSLMQKKILH